MPYSTACLLALQMDPNTANDKENTDKLIAKLSKQGVGSAATPQMLISKMQRNPLVLQTKRISYIVIAMGFLMMLWGIIAYINSLIHEKRSVLITLHLLGIPWVKIKLSWIIACTLSGVFPLYIGMCVSTWIQSNHHFIIPQSGLLHFLPVYLLAVLLLCIHLKIRTLRKEQTK